MDYKEALSVRTQQLKAVSEELRNKNRIIESLEEKLAFLESLMSKIDSKYHDVRLTDNDLLNELDMILEEYENNK